jgi:hypothetical protein
MLAAMPRLEVVYSTARKGFLTCALCATLISTFYYSNNSIQFIYVQNLTAQRPITKLAQARIIIQFNSIHLCAKLNSPEANYKVSTGKKMRRVRRNR